MIADFRRALFVAVAALASVAFDRSQPAMAQEKAAAAAGTVYVSRPSVWAGSLVTMNVYVNDKKAGSISDGKCIKLTLPAGRHKIQGYDPLWMGQLWGSDTGSVRVTVSGDSVTFVSITPTVVYPGQYTIYPARIVSNGRRC
jgi:hypothetical protein